MLRRSLIQSSFLAVSASALLLSATLAQAAATVGQPAPDFSATDLSGKTVKLSDFKGKHVVLEWVNPNCPFVKKHYNSDNMQAVQKEATSKGVVWLAINSTERQSQDYMTPAQLSAWVKEKSSPMTAMLMDEDGNIGKNYAARTTPHMYIVSPQGTLIYAGGIDSIPSGRVDDIKTATNYIKQGLNEALAGKPLSVATSAPYGCTVKYKS
ncbi:MAG: thioredoxin family protein [Burkholderiaceae bacterium]